LPSARCSTATPRSSARFESCSPTTKDSASKGWYGVRVHATRTRKERL
jgi:hypothetical protein